MRRFTSYEQLRGERTRRGAGFFIAGMAWLLLERYIHLGIAARCCGAHGGNDPFNVSAQGWPLLVSENDKSDFPARQVLLIPDVFVGRQQNHSLLA